MLAHPVGVALREVVVDRDDVHALAGERVQVGRQRRDQRLAFAGAHLGDLAVVQHHAADQLHVEVAHLQRALAGLAHDGEGFGQQLVERRAVGDALLELRRSCRAARRRTSFAIAGSSALICAHYVRSTASAAARCGCRRCVSAGCRRTRISPEDLKIGAYVDVPGGHVPAGAAKTVDFIRKRRTATWRAPARTLSVDARNLAGFCAEPR